MRYYRRNIDPRLRELERKYQSTGDVDSLMRLNRARKRAGLKAQCAGDTTDFSRYMRQLVRPKFRMLAVGDTQFPAFKISVSDTDDSPETFGSYDMSMTFIRSIIRETHNLGYFGLIDLGRDEQRKYRCDVCLSYVLSYGEPTDLETGDRYIDITCDDCNNKWKQEIRIPVYPIVYLFCYSLLEPTGDPIDLRRFIDAELVADQWMRYEDPRSLTDPTYRRGSYPTKVVLVRRPGTTWIKGILTKTDENFITWKYYVSYEGGVLPSLGHGNYDMHPIENGYVDYLIRLMSLPKDHDYELVY